MSKAAALRSGPGLRAPALVLFALLAVIPAAQANAQRTAQQQQQQVVPPDRLTVTKLVWSTMAAVHHANLTGNYSVVRELGGPSFQAANSPQKLAKIFADVRARRLDLSNALLVPPTYESEPRLLKNGMLRVRGSFRLRPNPIAFDLLFEPLQGHWRVYGVAVGPLRQ